MLLNYHEMTMEQSKDDPAKKQQFMVICTVMVSVLAYSLMTSGAFVAIAPVAGVFPGGYFCYKFASLDYAASMGLGRLIQKDLLAEFPKDETFCVHCAGGYRSVIASSILKSRGYHNIIDIKGGFHAIKNAGFIVTDYVCPSTLK